MAGPKTDAIPIVGQTGGNYYDKSGSRNPIVRRLMSGYFEAFDQLVEKTGAQTIHEIGCGEGDLSIRLAQKGASVRACRAMDIPVVPLDEIER